MPELGDVYTDENGKRWAFIKGEWRSEDDYGGGSGFLDRALAGISNWTQTGTGQRLVGNPVSRWAAEHPNIWNKAVSAGVGYGFGNAIASNRGTGGSSGSIGPGGGPSLANSDFINPGGIQRGGDPDAWYNTFWGQALINSGLNLAGGYLQGRATKKANEANQQAVQERIRMALAQLDPAQIAILVKQFLPEMAAISNPQQQTALQQLSVSQARQGISRTPYGLTAEAGLRGQMANQVSTAAFQRAMETASSRASAVTGAPFVTQQPNTGLADAFGRTAQQTLEAYARSRQPKTPAPFVMTGQATPQPWETQQYEGTPYQWPFQQARY